VKGGKVIELKKTNEEYEKMKIRERKRKPRGWRDK
jgi:hypothetical protein